jgi:ELWxxDGT repeat protein
VQLAAAAADRLILLDEPNWFQRLWLSAVEGRRQPAGAVRRRGLVWLETLEDRTLPSVSILPTNNNGNGYTGLDFNQSGGFTPPDTSGAAGPTSVVETVNQTVALYTPKSTGATAITSSLDNFWHTVGGLPVTDGTSELSDPIVTYNDQIGRFIVGDQDVDFNTHFSNFDIAVSKTSNPSTLTKADWNFYQISTTETGFDADYPGNFGYNHDAFVFTLNMFGSPFHVLVVSVNNSDLAAGVPNASLRVFRNDLNAASVRPTVMHDSVANDPMWLITEHRDNQSIDVIKMTSVLSNSASFATTNVPVTPYAGTAPPLNPDGSEITSNIDARIINAAERNQRIVASHSVGVSGSQDVVQWYVFDVSSGTPTLADQGRVSAGNNTYLTYPSVDINPSGQIGMTYMRSGTDSSTDFLSMYVTARTPSDPAGTMETPVLVPAGKGVANLTGGRAGDLSGISIDPNDGSFWALNEFANTEFGFANWGTAIANFTASQSVQFSQAIFNASESGGVATLTVTRAGDTSQGSSVHYVTHDGTAVAGTDYQASSGTANFAPGQSSTTITVPLIDDGDSGEPDQSFTVSLDSPTNGYILGSPSTAQMVIKEDQFGALAFTVTNYDVAENEATATITVARSGGSDGTVTVHYATSDGTATAGTDYTPASGTLTFNPGEISKTFTVGILDDGGITESDSSLNLTLSQVTGGATLGTPATATLTIHEIPVPIFQFNSATYSVVENNNGTSVQATITVTRTGLTTGTDSVSYATSDGTAVSGTDYLPASGTFTFNPGDTQKTFTVTVLDDGGGESDQTLNLTLSNPSTGAFLGTPASAVLDIQETAFGQLQFSQAAYSIDETAGTAVITVQRVGGSDGTATVHYSTVAGGTAVAGIDYTPVSGTLTFSSGVTSQTFTIPLLDDGGGENDSTVNLKLDTPTGGATLGTSDAVLTIRETQFGTLKFDSSNFTVNEQAGTATITVDRVGGSDGTVTVHYATSNGSGLAGRDYLAGSGTLTFNPGDTSKTFTVTILDDGVGESDRTVNLTLDTPSGGATLGTPSAAVLTIQETDFGQIQFGAAVYTVFEDGGSVTITVVRTGGSDGTSTIGYTTRNGTALAGTDYQAASGTLVFNAGDTSKSFVVTILDDPNSETNKIFNLSLDLPVGNDTLGSQGTAQVVIVPHGFGQLQFSSASYSVNQDAGLATITVTRSVGINGAVSVNYSTSDGTGIGGVNYANTSGTLSFAPGQTSAQFVVPILDNSAGPVNQTVNLTLRAPGGGATLGTPTSAVLTITETDFGQVQFAATGFAVDDNAGTATITVTRTAGAEGSITIPYSTSDGTARAGVDYIATSGTLTLAAGATSGTFTVGIINDNAPVNQTVNLALGTPGGGAALGAPSTAVLTIVTTDFGRISFAAPAYDASVASGAATITVFRDGAAGTVSVHYATADGSDHAGVNYVATSGVLTFQPGQLSQTFTVNLLSSGDASTDGTVNLSLDTAAGGASLGTPTSAVLRVHETQFGALQFAAGSYTVNQTAGTVAVRVVRVGGAANTVTVAYSTADGTGKAGVDYQTTSGTLTFGTGQSSEFITVPILNDTAGAGRSFTITLGATGGGATLGSPTSTQVTIAAPGSIPPLQQVLDVQLGAGSSGPEYLTNVNGMLFFTADDGVVGRELWESNGTPAGTFIVKDINPGQNGSDPQDLTNVNGALFFSADDGAHGRELWKSDGTAAGTVMVADINPGSGASNPTDLTNVAGVLFFAANDGSDGVELWRSNGTAAGTVMVRDIAGGAASSYPSDLTNVNGTLFFTANDGTHGNSLYRSDGSFSGTALVDQINTTTNVLTGLPNSANPQDLTNFNGTLFFSADDGVHGIELWKSTGSAAGTTLVKDINPGLQQVAYGVYLPESSNPHDLLVVGNTLYFAATSAQAGTELWKTDGTTDGTLMVTDIQPNNGGAQPTNLTNVNGTVYFTAQDGVHGTELWSSLGTAGTTNLVLDINPGSASASPEQLTNIGGMLYFTAEDGVHGTELWRSDGTAAGAVMVADIDPGAASSHPTGLTNVSNVLFFAADDGVTGTELWHVNDEPPTVNVPGTQSLNGSSLVFSTGSKNAITVTDPTAGSQPLQVTLTATNGLLALGSTTGITLSSASSSGLPTLVFSGSLAAVNAALNGLTFTSTSGPGNPAGVQISVNDLGGTGFGGPLTATGSVAIGLSGVDPRVAAAQLAAATGSSHTVFALTSGHLLFRHDTSGWVPLGAAVESITTATEASGNVVVFAITLDQGLFSFSNATGWRQVGAPGTIRTASAGTDAAGFADVFVLTAGNAMYEFDSRAGWFPLGAANTILSMSGTSQGRVVAVTADRSVFEFDPRFGWLRLTSAGFAASVQAVTQASGSLAVFVVTQQHGLYEYQDNGTWTHIGEGILSYAGGTDASGQANVFVTTQTGAFYEFSQSHGWRPLPTTQPVVSFTAADADQVFAALGDGSILGHNDTQGTFSLAGAGFLTQ